MISIIGYSKKNPHKIKWDSFTFPGGEIQVKLDTSVKLPEFREIVVEVELSDANEYMKLALLNDALGEEFGSNPIYTLKIGYFPYARQDRVANKGEALAAFVMCDLINTLEFDEVVVLDPHSNFIKYNLNNLTVRTQGEMIGQSTELERDILSGKVLMVAPDAGAAPKMAALSVAMNVDYIQGAKIRDTKTGKLSGFSYEGDVKGKDLIIVDDICDGGGTFIGLTKELLKGGAKSVALYVSHGIFSKGLYPLFQGGISHIYTTNSITTHYVNSMGFTRLYWS